MWHPQFYWAPFEPSSGYWDQMKTHHYLLLYALNICWGLITQLLFQLLADSGDSRD